jgi:hypothetical protein
MNEVLALRYLLLEIIISNSYYFNISDDNFNILLLLLLSQISCIRNTNVMFLTIHVKKFKHLLNLWIIMFEV